jgi:uncharacterized protein YjbI with pentapeptide repeats
MTTKNDKHQTQFQTGPIAHQLAKIATNGYLKYPHGQQSSGGQAQKKAFSRTGFSDKTVWDWLQLLAALAVPLAVAFGTTFFAYQQSQLADVQRRQEVQAANLQHQREVEAAADQQQEATLKTYLDDMSSLLLEKNLRTSKLNDEVRQIARAKTLTALRRLDPTRKGVLVQFLFESNLIQIPDRIVDLFGANLSGANLSDAYLPDANLGDADLSGASLRSADLSGANLFGADLSHANLFGAILGDAILGDADLRGADLSYATATPEQLNEARSLKGAIMPDGSRHS